MLDLSYKKEIVSIFIIKDPLENILFKYLLKTYQWFIEIRGEFKL